MYFFKINRYIVSGIYQGYFEITNGNYIDVGITFAVSIFIFILISIVAAHSNGVNLFLHREAFSNVGLFHGTPLILAFLTTLVVIGANDTFTFLSYSKHYLITFKFLMFYLMLTYLTLCLCIYYSGRPSTTYCLQNATQFFVNRFLYAITWIILLSCLSYFSMYLLSKITGQNIVILEDFYALGAVKSICTVISIMLGVNLFRKSEILKFSTKCV
jgi:hypothetical protein